MDEIIKLRMPDGGRYSINKDGTEHKVSIGGGRGVYRTASLGAPLGAFALGDAQVGTTNGPVLHIARIGGELRAVVSQGEGYAMVDGQAKLLHPWSIRRAAAKAH